MLPLRKLLPPEFWENLPEELKLFAREIRKALRNEGHVVIGVTGYPGVGKSNDVAILGALIDENYSFDKNICFIPTAKQIGDMYMQLPKYSVFHIDEASRGLHKHKWHDKVQQKINELYDTERENHFLCTILIMPRFQNFTENFRNFMITCWINIPEKGLAVFYKKDDDKDAKDPWHIDESYKKKVKSFGNKKIFERTISDKLVKEQMTDCYWFHSLIPAIPKEVWSLYQQDKKNSRFIKEEEVAQVDSASERKKKIFNEKMKEIIDLHNQGLNNLQVGLRVGLTDVSISRYLKTARELQANEGLKQKIPTKNNRLLNNSKDDDFSKSFVDGDKVLNVTQQNNEIDKILEGKDEALGTAENK
jgi:hypothetical protein